MVEKDFVLEEYKQLWSYYHKLLDERKNLLDWYFKVVTLPLGLVGFFVSTKSEQISLPHEIGATILVLIYLLSIPFASIFYLRLKRKAEVLNLKT